MIYLQLFLTYIKIGLFNFGGGYAMLSFIRHEVVDKHGWIGSQEFTDIVAISQTTPGPIGINSATYVGYAATVNAGYSPAMGALGSVVATIAVCLPSFAIVLAISRFYAAFRRNRHVEAAFLGLRPATVGLIAAAALMLMNDDNFVDGKSIALFAVAFALSWRFKVHPIAIIAMAALAGILLY
ncbi:MAG: chromate transporter [Tannerellaceae bacterium]|jgi:chromate transporter|nr:chromate transporter [Tannerellaceae bacterium]